MDNDDAKGIPAIATPKFEAELVEARRKIYIVCGEGG